jgi:peptidoglycan/xylan/chitin deacetylase (PgdA/CDA1 family)
MRCQPYLLFLCLQAAWATAQAPATPLRPLAPPGPAGVSTLAVEEATPLSAYAEGSDSRLALFITDPDSRWLPLVHGLKTIGVPVQVVRDVASAVKHKVVLAYPNLSPSVLDELEEFVEQGGTLVAVGEYHRLFRPLLGVDEGEDRRRRRLDFDPAGIAQLGLVDPEAMHLRLGLTDELSLAGTGWSKLAPGAERLASYEDGKAALVRHRVGQGQTYVFGFNVGTIFYRAQSGRDEWFARAYDNVFEPTSDVFLCLLAKIYQERNPTAVLCGTVPEGKPLAILLTHDVDYARSVDYALTFAEFERNLGLPATYFLQTKYVKDDLDTAFLDEAAMATLRKIAAMGHEVASHSVAHTPVFATLPMGDGQERFPEYHPSVKNKKLTLGATLLGELRVSKYLIETMLPDRPVVAFRPGYLGNPPTLPQALQATGYRYVSSLTASNVLTHLPYQQNRDRRASQELPVYEFAISMSDGNTDDFTERLPAAQAIGEKLARYGGAYVLLIHPNNLEDKFRFLQSFVKPWVGKAWFGTLGGFGQWWETRDHTGVDVVVDGDRATVRLSAPAPLSGLVLKVPQAWTQPTLSQGRVTAFTPGEVIVTAPKGVAILSMKVATPAR